jgi:hypothetical protein
MADDGPGERRTVRRAGCALLSATLFAACTHSSALAPTIRARAEEAAKRDAAVAAVIPEAIRSHQVEVRPSTRAGGANTYRYRDGPALASALLSAVQAAYQRADDLEELPQGGKYQRVIVFGIGDDDLDIRFVGHTGTGTATLRISVEALAGQTLARIRADTVEGIATRGDDTGLGTGGDVFEKAIAAAIQKVADDLAHKLQLGLAEP